jgi:4-amino-4-deoxy-L-arabinose transferase-like glycosyltransferase
LPRAFAASIALIILVAASVTAFATRRNSLTWDEPVMIASGARGLATGDFTMTWDQPPGMPYVYGAAVHLYDAISRARGGTGVHLPAEDGTIVLPPELAAQLPPSIHANGPVPRWGLYDRYDYARELFFKSGNDPESVAFAARLATVFIAVLLALAVAVFTWRTAGPPAALLATSLFAFLPDELAQGGIAYNDVALALCFFIGLWAIDHCIRRPSVRAGAVAGASVGLALGVKFSALTLGPAAIVLLVAEWTTRRRDAAWWKRIAIATLVAAAVALVVLFAVYGGDVTLTQFREGVREQLRHSSSGHGVPAYLFGHTSDDGMWYFFPVALVLKTPIAFHVAAIAATYGFIATWSRTPPVAASPLRFLVVGIVVYLGVLMQSKLDIGVRYALAVMPMFAILVAVGLARLWGRAHQVVRVAIATLVVASAASAVVRYPWYLSYITEWVPAESRSTAMVDSNYDWGQGLLALRDFMRAQDAGVVYLGYFGSALPEGYGIRYSPLPSWSPLPSQPRPASPPQWVVVSATLLQGLYETGDPFRTLRGRKPDAVIGESLFAYRYP